jgi:hypothetical protein
LCQYGLYMFRWSSHHHQEAPKVKGCVLHLKSYSIPYKKQSRLQVCDNSRLPKSLRLK